MPKKYELGFVLGVICALLLLLAGGGWLLGQLAGEPAAEAEPPAPTDEPEGPSPGERFGSFAAGDVVVFGRFEQDGSADNGPEPLRWLVLEQNGDRLTLLSRQCLDARPFLSGGGEASWAESDLRAWLNGAFLNDAFDDRQKAAIVPTVLAESYVSDPIYLLSASEVRWYFSSEEAARTDATRYAVKRGVYRNESSGSCWWWLRSPGEDGQRAAVVYSYGEISKAGKEPGLKSGGVRPALTLDLSALGSPGDAPKPDAPVEPELAAPGDTVLFGRFEQDGDEDNGPEPIEWLVLASEDGELLLLSKNCLDARPFHGGGRVTWSGCELRAWLNGEFSEDCFSPKEKSMLLTTDRRPSKNPGFPVYAGAATADVFFLLSFDEAERLLPSAAARRAPATPYAAARGPVGGDGAVWWLCTPGRDRFRAGLIGADGALLDEGATATEPQGVRPAVWIRVD